MKPLAEMVLAVVLDLPDEDPEVTCHHIAMTPRQVAQALHDVGRYDLADLFVFFRRGVRPGHRRREDVAADVEALTGESPEEVCRHLDMTPGAVAGALYRSGRPDLAHPFWAIDGRSARRRRQSTPDAVGGCHQTARIPRGATA